MNSTEHNSAFAANRSLWNAMASVHVDSAFYDVPGFIAGRSSLTSIEMEFLGDTAGKNILHLQCHFGQDTLSLARMGAKVTGLDLSDVAIEKAKELAGRCDLDADWVCSNVLEFQPQLEGIFDLVFTSFGTIGWLPQLKDWAANIKRYLKPGGRFVFVEFHPVIWMFDNDFRKITYPYFNRDPIIEIQKGSYASPDAPIEMPAHGWNHDLGEVLSALLGQGLQIERFEEFDGSPHDCFANSVKGEDGLFRIKGLEGKIPMVYALTCSRPEERR